MTLVNRSGKYGSVRDEAFEVEVSAVASDRVIRRGEDLVVHASMEMPEWLVREFRQVVINFEGKSYYVAGKRALGRGHVSYELKPWTEANDIPGKIFHYDDEYVQHRNRAVYSARKTELKRTLLVPFLPLLGFLWGSTKSKLEQKLGISPRTATLWSVITEWGCVLVLAVLLMITVWVGAYFSARGATVFILRPLYLLAAIALILPDSILRTSGLLKEDHFYAGAYEWLFWSRRQVK